MEIKKLLWFCSIFILVHCKKKPKSVTTIIDAKWEVTPLVLEIAEYIAEENELSFWKYLDSIANLNPPLSQESTDLDQYNRALDVANSFLSPSQISLLKFALSLHIYSPKIEMYGQIAKESGLKCSAAIDIAGEIVCHDVVLQEKKIITALVSDSQETEILLLDHVHPESKSSAAVVILYATIGTPQFRDSHKLLSKLTNEGKIKYVFRHWVKERPPRKLRLSGYGVELQMKSTEYKVQDDTKVEGVASDDSEEEEEEVEGLNFSKLRQLYPDKVKELDVFRQALLESTSELAPLKVWQFQELSLQAAQRIMSAPKEEALHVMTHIAQNFPSQARSLVKTHVSPELKNEIRENQDRFSSSLHLQPSDTALFINGMYFDLETQDVFSILDYLRMELRVMEGLHNIGITEKKVLKSLLGLDLSSSGSDYALDFRDSAVMWLNDIESDKRYRLWSSSLRDLLRPTFPGMLRSIRRNLYNLVIIGDPSQKSVTPLIRLMQSFLVHSAPMRLGIVFAVDSSKTGLENSGVAMLNAFNYISELKDPSEAINFITDVYEVAGEDEIQPEHISNLLKVKFPEVVTSEIFGSDSDYNTGLTLSADFLSRSGLRRMPQALFNGVPLPEKSLTADEFEEVVLSEVMNQTPKLQKAVYRDDLTDRHDVVDYMMSKPNVMPRLNDRILSTSKAVYIDLTNFAEPATSKLLDGNIYYFVRNENQKLHLLTIWLVLDLNSQDGKKLLKHALEYMESNGSIRIAVILNTEANEEPPNSLNMHVANLMMKSHNMIDLKELLSSKENTLTSESADVTNLLRTHRKFCQDVLKFKKGEVGVVSNGRVIGPFDEGEDFNLEDFGLLDRFSMSSYIQKIEKTISKTTEDRESITSDMLMKCVSLLVSRPETKSRYEINAAGEKHSVVKITSINEGPTFNLIAITDPISHGAHKLSTILSVLLQVVNCDIKIFLNCVEKNSDMPLKSFYRYVLEPSITFSSTGQLGSGPIAKFSNMPGTPLLTQNMLVPDNWMVESIASPHDLDNIKLDQVDSNVHSQFELEYLILEGHCFDSMVGSPPRGLQVTLGTDSAPTQFDTIVMANLGYLQLKAGPGAWKLRLRHGRSAALYDITGYSHEGVDFPINNSEIKVLLSSFRAHTIKLKVTKKPDKMSVDLLGDDNDEQQSLWGSLTSTFGGRDETNDNKEENINVFSVASGHLYERFLRIMMLSVLKHTQKPVKFWFLKNYLSPTFKDFLPRMAKHYKFQYELVQYKWPRWLHQQTEKQRIIWGYKILFLDVLFPLDVKKIIFVDADQVVRADLNELVELDLGGAPYGYTPFCDSRTEMDGFRFWKQGYWRNHLQGRRYHISALYVVDLKRFRRIAAGDRLRGQYQALSQDPNSLSNLDQDLPNNMIHQVAIKSLPQEWLWCETWCDDSSKKRAKTIDLCNNPLTKEAKLTAAMRIVPEWKDYDNEIKQVQLKLGETEDHEEEQVHDSHQAKHSEL